MDETYEKKIKLFAFDIDGTLFNSDRVATLNTRQALNELQASGVQPIIATGRPRMFLAQLLDDLDMTIPFIGSNGAVILNENRELLYACETSLEQHLAGVLSWAEENEYGIMCEFLDGSITRFASDEVIASFDDEFQSFFERFPRSKKPQEDFNKPVIKMSFRLKGRQEIQADDLTAVFPDLNFVNSGYDCVDLTAVDAHKGNALKRYAEKMGIDLSEVAAIGDQTNDITMLQTAGLPIAMGNAIDELKKVARWIAPTNDEDGAAWAMKKIIALNKKIA